MMLYSLMCFLISICIILLILFLLMGNDKMKIKLACVVPFIFVVFFFILFFNKNIILSLHDIKVDFFGNIGSYLGGVFGTIFTMLTTGLLIFQIYNQHIATSKKDITDKFYKHLDIHMQDLFALDVKNVIADKENERSGGRRAFVVFRIQIKYIIQALEALSFWNILPAIDQMKIIFVIFYHGYSEKWKDDFKDILEKEVSIDAVQVDRIIKLLENYLLRKARGNYNQIKTIERVLSHWCKSCSCDDCCCRINGSGFQSKLLRSLDSIDRLVSFLEEECPSLYKILKDKNGDETKVIITRTNLTSVSSYFENMFYAINLIDKAEHFDLNEKRNLVDMFICQLSEPEKFVFFFYLRSSFGEKWKNENLLKYNLLSGLTTHYCFGYDPNILLR